MENSHLDLSGGMLILGLVNLAIYFVCLPLAFMFHGLKLFHSTSNSHPPLLSTIISREQIDSYFTYLSFREIHVIPNYLRTSLEELLLLETGQRLKEYNKVRANPLCC